MTKDFKEFKKSQEFPVKGSDLLRWRQRARRSAHLEEIPLGEVDWLLREISSLTSLELRLESFVDRPAIYLNLSLETLEQRWQKRLKERSPIQYLAGSTPWRNLHLQVTPGVLIPRPETEILIDLAIAASRSYPELTTGNWVDMGTGSGAIAIALAEVFPQAIIHGVDKSSTALAIALANAENYGYTSPQNQRIHFHQGSWWEPLDCLRGEVQAMISNPPYIPTGMIAKLQPEVTHHEPHAALDGGEDGLDDLRHLIATSPDYLKSGGLWLVETMAGQPEVVMQLLQAQGSYRDICSFPDFASLERFVQAVRC